MRMMRKKKWFKLADEGDFIPRVDELEHTLN